MLLTLGLVRMLGARRTRIVAQIVGALAGALLVIASQLHALSSRQTQDGIRDTVLGLVQVQNVADSLLWLPARAMLGEPLPVLLLGALACSMFRRHRRRRGPVSGVACFARWSSRNGA
jgi:ABC-2 type transport system permease protein